MSPSRPVFRPVRCLRRAVAAGLLLAACGAEAQVAPATPDAATASATPEAAGLLRLATTLSAKGDYATAEIAYRQVLARADFPVADQKTALLGLAHMFRKAGTVTNQEGPAGLAPAASGLTKAVAIYEKFLKEYPDDFRVPDAFLDLGRTLRDMGAYNLALTSFYSVINSTLKLTAQGFDHYTLLAKTAQFEIAQTYYESGDYAEAGKFFTRVRLLDLATADRARAHFMAGCAQQRAGELEAAVGTLRAFLEQWPDNENIPEARYLLATSLDALKRPQEAMAVTLALLNAEHSLVATDPRRWSYWQRRTGNQLANQFFQNGDALNALAIYNCLAALSPEPAWRLPVLYQTALCYERLFQVDRAEATYQEIIVGGQPKVGAPAPTPEVAELAGMAQWRETHLQWQDGINHRLTEVLAPSTMPAAPTSKASAPPLPAS
jgi:tetratricopeptide (TPR) repeat protein